MECLICKSNSGKQRISPGPMIYDGKYWIVEHAYPSKLLGWLVIDLKRHVEALHELTSAEFSELSKLIEKSIKVLKKLTKCEKEYVMCLAEHPDFHHIHVHIVPKPKDLPKELKGAKIFAMLKIPKENAIPKTEIRDFCEELIKEFK